jgi:hypothetical protein
VTNFKPVPSKFFAIHSSILRFTSGLKWFFQLPVWPFQKPTKIIHFYGNNINLLILQFIPLRTNVLFGSSLPRPALISFVKLTDSFLENLSKRTWSTSFSICAGVTGLFRKVEILLIWARMSFFNNLNYIKIIHSKIFYPHLTPLISVEIKIHTKKCGYPIGFGAWIRDSFEKN